MSRDDFAVVRLRSGWAAVYATGPKRLGVVETRSRYGTLTGFSSRGDAEAALSGDLAKGFIK